MIYNLYIYNKKGKCVYYREWNRAQPAENLAEEQQLIFGLLSVITTFVEKTSPEANDKFTCYTTSSYKLHFFESATGFRFLVNTDPKTPTIQKDLRKIYSDYFVEFVCKNPMYKLGETITCSYFVNSVDKFFTSHPNFKSE